MHLVCFFVVGFRFLKVVGVNQDDKASEWQEKIETTPELLAELKDKAAPTRFIAFRLFGTFRQSRQ
jgi:hypothetical protein